MKRTVALFDFDDTISKGDSIYHLLKYDLMKRPYHIFKFIPLGINYIRYLMKKISFEDVKAQLLFPLNTMDDEELKYFYKYHVANHYYPHMVKKMQEHKDKGDYVILCTASSEIYMKYSDLPFDKMIGTIIEKENNMIRIVDKNCKGQHKVPRILKHLEEMDIQIDYESSYGYSDSDADIPMLELVKNKIRIAKKSGEMSEFIPKTNKKRQSIS